MINVRPGIQKWLTLILLWLCVFVSTYSQNQMSGLSTQIMEVFGLTAQQYSIVYTSPNWMAVILGVIVGGISDRVGVRKMITIAATVGAIGLILRIFVSTFSLLFITNLLTGFLATVASCNRAKVLGAWFKPEEMPLAMGLVMTVSPVASTLGIGTTALFPSIQAAFIVGAVVAIVAIFLWLAFGKEKPDNVVLPPSQPVARYLGKVAKNPYVWVIALAGFFVMGAQVTVMAFMSASLQSRGLAAVSAGGMATSFTIAMGVGSIITPFITRAIGRFRPVIAIYTIIGAACIFCGWMSPIGIAMYLIMFVAGFIVGSMIPIIFTSPFYLVGQEYVASATGFLLTLQLLGASTIVPYIIVPLCKGNFTMMYGMGAICFLLAGILAFLVPEFGPKGKLAQKKAAEVAAAK